MKFLTKLLTGISIPVATLIPATVLSVNQNINLKWANSKNMVFTNNSTTINMSQTTTDHKHWTWSIAASSDNVWVNASNYANQFSVSDLSYYSKINLSLEQSDIDSIKAGNEIKCSDLKVYPKVNITTSSDSFMNLMLRNINSNNREWSCRHGGGFRWFVEGDHNPKINERSVSSSSTTIYNSLNSISGRISSIGSTADSKMKELLDNLNNNKVAGILVSYRAYSDSLSRGNSDTRGDEYGDCRNSYAYFYNFICINPGNLYLKLDAANNKVILYDKDDSAICNYHFIVTTPGLTNVGKSGDALEYNYLRITTANGKGNTWDSRSSNSGSDISVGVGWKDINWNVNVSESFTAKNIVWSTTISNPLIE